MCIRDSKKTGDYHEDMNVTVFESWFFDTLLPSIPQGATMLWTMLRIIPGF